MHDRHTLTEMHSLAIWEMNLLRGYVGTERQNFWVSQLNHAGRQYIYLVTGITHNAK